MSELRWVSWEELKEESARQHFRRVASQTGGRLSDKTARELLAQLEQLTRRLLAA